MPKFVGWFSQQQYASTGDFSNLQNTVNGVKSSINNINTQITEIGNGKLLKKWSENVTAVMLDNIENSGIIYIYYSMERYENYIRGYLSFPVVGCNGRRLTVHNRGGEDADRNYDGYFDITYNGSRLLIVSGSPNIQMNILEVRKMG